MYKLNVISVHNLTFTMHLPLLLNWLVLQTRPLYPLRQRSRWSMCNIGSVMFICFLVPHF